MNALLFALAVAQTSGGFSLSRFDPAERGSDWFLNESLDLRGDVRPGVGVIADWALRPLVVYDDSGKREAAIVRDSVLLHPGATLILFDRLRLALSLPVAVYQSGQTGQVGNTVYSPPSTTAIGDLRIGADVRIVGEYRGPFQLAAGVQLHTPTGNRTAYMSDGTVRFVARAMLAGELSYFIYALKVGFQYRPLVSDFASTPLGSELSMSAAVGARFFDGRIVIGPEVAVSTVTANPRGLFSLATATNFEALAGIHYRVVDGLKVSAGAGPGLSRGLGTPELRVVGGVEWALEPKEKKPVEEEERPPLPPPPPGDRDRDGILDQDDACPDKEGLHTANPSTNGCPDSDGDMIFDNVDMCPFVPGVESRNAKKMGCPSDRDDDDIADLEDACPDEKGRASDDRRKNGCPDKDGDGFIDRLDACPALPGIAWTDPSKDGCPPEGDRDEDGIKDSKDACPDQKGVPNAEPDKNGCPLAIMVGNEIRISQQVKFATGSAKILPDSDALLNAVAEVMRNNGTIGRVVVEGHTDNKGAPKKNLDLSQARAASVVQALVDRGVPQAKLSAKGWGQEKPIDSNKSERGRKNNRRVEFHIVE